MISLKTADKSKNNCRTKIEIKKPLTLVNKGKRLFDSGVGGVDFVFPKYFHTANVSHAFSAPPGQAFKYRKTCSSEMAWQVFSVLIRSMAALDCGVGGYRTNFILLSFIPYVCCVIP